MRTPYGRLRARTEILIAANYISIDEHREHSRRL